MPRLKNEDLDLLAQMLQAEEEDDPNDSGERHEATKKEWLPILNPTQQELWDDPSDVIGACGPKFSGKTSGLLDCIVRHCYLEWDALFWIIGNNAAALGEGPCSDLVKFILPRWRDGNVEPPYMRVKGLLVPNPKAGQQIDNGIGLEYLRWRFDAQTKHPIMRIKNQFGGWSRIRVISIPHPDLIDERVRGPAPSGVYLEEATKCKGKAYYTYPQLQLYRRRDIVGPQPFLFSCNPEGPENWVYEWMYKDVVVSPDLPGNNWPNDREEPGIRRRKNVSFRFVPYEENAHNVSQKNREILEDTLKNDATLTARLRDGKWISVPSGDSIFKDEFTEAQHIRGEYKEDKEGVVQRSVGLTPNPGYPLVIGYDLGNRSVGISFQQIIEAEPGPFLLIFDELCYHKEFIASRRLARAMLEKLVFWNNWLREHDNNPDASWSVWHIAADDATTVYRPDTDSVDSKNMELYTTEIIASDPERYRGIEPFLIRGCPRPPGSREKRVDLMAEAMVDGRFMCSALCPWHRQMLLHLEVDPDAPSTPKRSKWLESFDASTYPMMYRHLRLPGGFYDLTGASPFSVTI